MSHAMQGSPRRIGYSEEFWQNGVHWTREWETTSVFLTWEPHEQYERQKDMTVKDELPRLVGAQYAIGDQWRNNSKKNCQLQIGTYQGHWQGVNNNGICHLPLWRWEMATHSSTLAWKIPRTERPGRLQSMGLQRVGHNWVTSLHFLWRLNPMLL